MKPSVILMGSKPGSVVALNILLKRGWEIPYVVVSRKYKYNWIGGPTLEEEAIRHGIKVVTQPELPKNVQVDFVISYMFRYRVKAEVIKLAKKAALNFHAGPLPEYGGWAFYNLAILEDATEYGCTCHYMDDNFDTGPLFKVNRFPINAKTETAYSLERKAQEEMIRLFIDFCVIAESKQPLPIEIQDQAKMRYMDQPTFQKLKKIPIEGNEELIQKYARAFWYPPYECAYINYNGSKVEIIPNLVKERIAKILHEDDLEVLLEISNNYKI